MAGEFFPSADKCGITPPEQVPAGHMLTSDSVPAAPGDVMGCPDLREHPLAEAAPLPTFTVNGTNPATGFVSIAGGGPQPISSMGVTSNGCGAFDVDINIRMPPGGGGGGTGSITCPVLNPPDVTYGYGGPGSSPLVTFTITQSALACEFDFALGITFPCPLIVAGGGTVLQGPPGSDGTAALTVTPSAGCAFTLGLDVTFPCPSIIGGAVYQHVPATAAGDIPENAELTVTADAECGFDVNLDVTFPCVNLYPGTVAAYWADSLANPSFSHAPTVSLQINPSAAECEYSFDLEVQVPCVRLRKGGAALLDGCAVEIALTKVEDCVWEIGLKQYNCVDDLVIDVMTDKWCGVDEFGGPVESFRFSRLHIPGAIAADLGWYEYHTCVPCDIEVGNTSTTFAHFAADIVDVTRPVSVVSGDLLVAAVSSYFDTVGVAPTAPAGWALLRDVQNLPGKVRTQVWHKFATATEPASYTFTTGAQGHPVVCIQAFRNAGHPEDITFNSGVAPDTAHVAIGVTTGGDHRVILGVWATQKISGGPPALTLPVVMDEKQNDVDGIAGSRVTQGVALELIEFAGASGSRVAGSASPPDGWAAVLIAIPPDCSYEPIAATTTSTTTAAPGTTTTTTSKTTTTTTTVTTTKTTGPPGGISTSCCNTVGVPATMYVHVVGGSCNVSIPYVYNAPRDSWESPDGATLGSCTLSKQVLKCTGTTWTLTFVASGGHSFSATWNTGNYTCAPFLLPNPPTTSTNDLAACCGSTPVVYVNNVAATET